MASWASTVEPCSASLRKRTLRGFSSSGAEPSASPMRRNTVRMKQAMTPRVPSILSKICALLLKRFNGEAGYHRETHKNIHHFPNAGIRRAPPAHAGSSVAAFVRTWREPHPGWRGELFGRTPCLAPQRGWILEPEVVPQPRGLPRARELPSPSGNSRKKSFPRPNPQKAVHGRMNVFSKPPG